MANEIKRDTVDYRDPTPFDGSKLHTIEEISEAIRHKMYGKDVREPIAQQGERLAEMIRQLTPEKFITKQGTINMAENTGIKVTSAIVEGVEYWFGVFPICFITNYNGDYHILLDPANPVNDDKNGFDLSHIAGVGGYVCWSPSKNKILTYKVEESFADDDIIIGFAWWNGEFHFNGNANYTFNDVNEHQFYPELAMYNGTGNNWNITVTDTTWVLNYSAGWVGNGSITQLIEDGSTDATNIKDYGGWILVNRDKSVSVSRTDKPIPTNVLVIGMVWADGRVLINGHTKSSDYEYGAIVGYDKKILLNYLTVPSTTNIFLSVSGGMPHITSTSGIYEAKSENKDGFDLTGLGIEGGPIVFDKVNQKIYGVPKKNLKDMYDRHIVVGWGNINHVFFYTDIPYSINGIMVNSDSRFNDYNILTCGDSVTKGYLNQTTVTDRPYPFWIENTLNTNVNNVAVSGKLLSGDADGDLLPVLKSNDLTKYRLITIAYGINDWNDGIDLVKVTTRLQEAIDYIWSKNPGAYIMGITPSPVWRHTGDDVDLDSPNVAGNSQREFIGKLIEVYEKNQIPVFDLRKAPAVTKQGWHKQSVDGIHPTEETHKLLGNRIANFIKTNV